MGMCSSCSKFEARLKQPQSAVTSCLEHPRSVLAFLPGTCNKICMHASTVIAGMLHSSMRLSVLLRAALLRCMSAGRSSPAGPCKCQWCGALQLLQACTATSHLAWWHHRSSSHMLLKHHPDHATCHGHFLMPPAGNAANKGHSRRSHPDASAWSGLLMTYPFGLHDCTTIGPTPAMACFGTWNITTK